MNKLEDIEGAVRTYDASCKAYEDTTGRKLDAEDRSLIWQRPCPQTFGNRSNGAWARWKHMKISGRILFPKLKPCYFNEATKEPTYMQLIRKRRLMKQLWAPCKGTGTIKLGRFQAGELQGETREEDQTKTDPTQTEQPLDDV